MKKLLALLVLLLVAPAASAAPRCTLAPVHRRIAHGIYLQQTVLRCWDQTPAVDSAIQRARDWISLCREAGGAAPECAAALSALDAPRAHDALVVARAAHAAALEPIAAPIARPASASAPPLRWENPRLLTNLDREGDGAHP